MTFGLVHHSYSLSEEEAGKLVVLDSGGGGGWGQVDGMRVSVPHSVNFCPSCCQF